MELKQIKCLQRMYLHHWFNRTFIELKLSIHTIQFISIDRFNLTFMELKNPITTPSYVEWIGLIVPLWN